MENKQIICTMLLMTCKATKQLSDLVNLMYDEDNDKVIAMFASGAACSVNVMNDSGAELISDVINELLAVEGED